MKQLFSNFIQQLDEENSPKATREDEMNKKEPPKKSSKKVKNEQKATEILELNQRIKFSERELENTYKSISDTLDFLKNEKVTSSELSEEVEKKIKSSFIKLYVLIDGILEEQTGGIVLEVYKGLKDEHYLEMVNEYYSEVLFNGSPPGNLILIKQVTFENGNKFLKFDRKFETQERQYQIEFQKNLSIFEEKPPNPLSIELSTTVKGQKQVFPRFISLNRLILLLTDPFYNKEYIKVLWWTYRSFISPKILLSKLLERIDPKSGKFEELKDNEKRNYSTVELTYYNTFLKPKIELNVLNLLYQFSKHYFSDFEDDMIEELDIFLETNYLKTFNRKEKKKPKRFIVFAKHIRRELKKERGDALENSKNEQHDDNTKELNDEENQEGTKKRFNILDYSPKEFAESISSLDFKIYKKIGFKELLNQNWKKQADETLKCCPNLVKRMKLENIIFYWVIKEIVFEREEELVAKRIEFFIKSCIELRRLNGLNMLKTVSDALNSEYVVDLVNSLEISEKLLKANNDIHQFLTTSGNYQKIRLRMNTLHFNGIPTSPFIGVFLQYLTFNEENETLVEGKINFYKLKIATDIMDKILRFQKIPFLEKLTKINETIIQKIQSFNILDEEQMKIKLKEKSMVLLGEKEEESEFY